MINNRNNSSQIFNTAQDLGRLITNERNNSTNNFYNNNYNSDNRNNNPAAINITVNASTQNEQNLASRIAQAVRDALNEIEGLNARTSYA